MVLWKNYSGKISQKLQKIAFDKISMAGAEAANGRALLKKTVFKNFADFTRKYICWVFS